VEDTTGLVSSGAAPAGAEGDELARRWPSLADQLAVATALYGPRGPELVGLWVGEQLGLVGDLDFGGPFAEFIGLPGVPAIDYSHRVAGGRRGELLGGIRFFGGDRTRPFVDVLAHSFDDERALADCVAAEWAGFAPPFMRLRVLPQHAAGESRVLDQSVHVGRCRQMSAPDGPVGLSRFSDADEAVALVAERYAALSADQPDLAANISAAEPDDLRYWHEQGALWAIRVDAQAVGALAVAPGEVEWITGPVVQEEVIAPPWAGRGYAAAAQSAWAAMGARRDPDALLIGTIDRRNTASRLSAERAGRPAVLSTVFVALRHRGAKAPTPATDPDAPM